jgi:hypothetical protein
MHDARRKTHNGFRVVPLVNTSQTVPMKRLLLRSLAIAALTGAGSARADSTEALCQLSRHDHTVPIESSSCLFSQRQGNATVLMGKRWSFRFLADEAGKTYERTNSDEGIRFNREGDYTLSVLWRRALRCEGPINKPVSVVYLNQAQPPSVDLMVGEQQVRLPIARSASGARYSGSGVELWLHQGTTRIEWQGQVLSCQDA